MTKRRTFLKYSAMLSAGFFVKPNLLFSASNKVAGLQLYSLRDQLPKDVKGTITKVAQAGYKEVETFGYNKQAGYWGLTAKEFAQLLKDNGLSTPSGHYDCNQFFDNGNTENLDTYIEAAHATGQEYIIVPSLNERFIKTGDDFKQVAEKMNKMAELLKKSDLKLGYHNHNFEFVAQDGQLPCIRWPGSEVHVWKHRLWAMPARMPVEWSAALAWQGETLLLPGGILGLFGRAPRLLPARIRSTGSPTRS